MDVSALTALSSDEPGEEDVLDAGSLLDVLRLYRWHISSFEEQVSHSYFRFLCIMYLTLFYWRLNSRLIVSVYPLSGCTWTFSCPHIFSGGGAGPSTQSDSFVWHAVSRGELLSPPQLHTNISSWNVWRKGFEQPPSSNVLKSVRMFVLYQSLPDQDEKTMTCRSRGKETEMTESRISNHKEIYLICICFTFCSPSSSYTKSLEVSASVPRSSNKQHVLQALRTTSESVCLFPGSEKQISLSVITSSKWFMRLLSFI